MPMRDHRVQAHAMSSSTSRALTPVQEPRATDAD